MENRLLALGFAMLMLVPATAMAFHGSAYDAHGTAVGTNGRVYLADVSWSWGTYTVKFRDTLNPTLFVVNDAFAGYESNIGGGPIPSTWEIFLYHGRDLATNGDAFEVIGFQQILLLPQLQQMVYVGHYHEYQLQLVVDGVY
jgi:hypothetical protein